jgi:hypothetical protein
MSTAKHGIAYRTLSEGAVKLTTCPQARITSSHQFYDVLACEFSREWICIVNAKFKAQILRTPIFTHYLYIISINPSVGWFLFFKI